MERDVNVRIYFTEHAPPMLQGAMANGTINALERGGITTMNALCGATEGELRKIRNLGEKRLALTLTLREKFLMENGGTGR